MLRRALASDLGAARWQPVPSLQLEIPPFEHRAGSRLEVVEQLEELCTTSHAGAGGDRLAELGDCESAEHWTPSAMTRKIPATSGLRDAASMTACSNLTLGGEAFQRTRSSKSAMRCTTTPSGALILR